MALFALGAVICGIIILTVVVPLFFASVWVMLVNAWNSGFIATMLVIIVVVALMLVFERPREPRR